MGAAELRPSQDRSEPHSLSSSALLHDRLCAADISRFATIPCSHGSRANAANVRREEHDVRSGPASWTLPHSCSAVPWPYVDERGRRADAERAEQEQLLFRGV